MLTTVKEDDSMEPKTKDSIFDPQSEHAGKKG